MTIEQRNRYKGDPPRPWIRLILVAMDGSSQALDLVVDTGCPCAVVASTDLMARFSAGDAPDLSTNFGSLSGGWVQVMIRELNLDCVLTAYGSDAVVSATKESSLEFDGLVGLPLLRMFEYGGNADWFWLKLPKNQP